MLTPSISASSTSLPAIIRLYAFSTQVCEPPFLNQFPFADAIPEFIAAHDHVFVVEQNRDAQLRALLLNECGLAPDKLIPVLHYDGNPLTARFIVNEIGEKARALGLVRGRPAIAAD